MKSNQLTLRDLLRVLLMFSMAVAVLSGSAAMFVNAQTPSDDFIAGEQSPVMTSSSFGREPGRNGLQSPGSLSISVEAIFGNVMDSNALIAVQRQMRCATRFEGRECDSS